MDRMEVCIPLQRPRDKKHLAQPQRVQGQVGSKQKACVWEFGHYPNNNRESLKILSMGMTQSSL